MPKGSNEKKIDAVVEQSMKRSNQDSESGTEDLACCKKQKSEGMKVHNKPKEENHMNNLAKNEHETNTEMDAIDIEEVNDEVDNEDSYVYVKVDNIDITRFDPVKISDSVQQLLERMPEIKKSNRSLRILCKNTREKRILMNTWYLAGQPVVFSEPHRRYINTTKRGIIFDVDEDISTNEIEHKTGIKAKRITKRVGGEIRTTKQVILHFDEDMPAYIYLGWKRFRVETFIPEPIRCYNCQKYGHKSNNCNSKIKCPICSKNHSYEKCESRNNNNNERRAVCPNCREGHPASYKGCRVYQEAKSIKRIQVTNSLSYAEAVKSLRNKKTLEINIANIVQPRQTRLSTSGELPSQVSTDNSSQDKTIPDRCPPNDGKLKPNNSVEENSHHNCVNTDVLIKFVQSISVLLSSTKSKEELVAILHQMVEKLVKSIKQPHENVSLSK